MEAVFSVESFTQKSSSFGHLGLAAYTCTHCDETGVNRFPFPGGSVERWSARFKESGCTCCGARWVTEFIGGFVRFASFRTVAVVFGRLFFPLPYTLLIDVRSQTLMS